MEKGAANALDLTDRILPRLQAPPHCHLWLLNFPPYSRQELTAIVEDRLSQVCLKIEEKVENAGQHPRCRTPLMTFIFIFISIVHFNWNYDQILLLISFSGKFCTFDIYFFFPSAITAQLSF